MTMDQLDQYKLGLKEYQSIIQFYALSLLYYTLNILENPIRGGSDWVLASKDAYV